LIDIYLEDYAKTKEMLEQEIKRFPAKENELILLYSPVINYHATRFAEQILHDRWVGLNYALV
jgi:hypothetical protein